MSHTSTASVASILKESADRFPDEIAVTVGPQSTTYAELWDQTRAYAGALRAKGVTEGSRVAMLVPNVADFPRVYYAILALGAVAVPIHALLKQHEIEYVLRDSGSTMLVCAAPAVACTVCLGAVILAARERLSIMTWLRIAGSGVAAIGLLFASVFFTVAHGNASLFHAHFIGFFSPASGLNPASVICSRK